MLVAGAFLVPALSLPEAVVAIVVGALIGNLMLAAAGAIGADARVPAMVLMRAPLGRRGSYLPTVLNVAQCLGWAIFELIIIAAAAAALSEKIFGFEGRSFWTLVFGACAGALALLGPVGFVRRFVRRFALWAVLASLLYLSWWAIDGADLGSSWRADGEGGSSVVLGIDLVVAITVTWIPLAADYTRFCRSRSSAFVGTFVGYLIPSLWMFLLGSLLVLGRDLSDPVAVPAAVAAAGVTAAIALFAVTVDETDEAFANTYSTAVSLQNLLPGVPQRLLVVASAMIATVGALDDRVAELRSLPAPARLVLRAALRRPARRLAPRRSPLHRRGRLPRPRLPARADRRLARRLRALPVAAPDRAELVDRPRRPGGRGSAGDRRDPPELPRRLPPHRRFRRARKQASRRQGRRVTRSCAPSACSEAFRST